MHSQDLLKAAIHSGSRGAVVALRGQFRDSPEMLDLWDWFDQQFSLAARNRARLEVVEAWVVESATTPKDTLELRNALIELFHALKIDACLTEILYVQNEHHHTSMMLPTDGTNVKETIERVVVMMNKRFPHLKGEWDVFCQNWP